MNLTCILFGLLFLAVGLVFFMGKGHGHIAAWRNMTQSERAKVKIGPLCRNVGAVIALGGLIFLTSGLWSLFRERAFIWFMIGWLVLAGVDVYYIGKSGRYERTETNGKGELLP